ARREAQRVGRAQSRVALLKRAFVQERGQALVRGKAVVMPALAANLEVVLVLLGVEQLVTTRAADPHVVRHPMTGVIGAVRQGHVLRATAEDLFHASSTIT